LDRQLRAEKNTPNCTIFVHSQIQVAAKASLEYLSAPAKFYFPCIASGAIMRGLKIAAALGYKSKISWILGMWIEKLVSGVLRVLTPLGPRYLRPSFTQRLYLLWVFRHFETLPVKVLTSRQRRLIENMWAQDRFVSFGMGVADAPLLGTLEQRPPVSGQMPTRRPAESVNDGVRPFAADVRRQ
jgi:hypothetical protein